MNNKTTLRIIPKNTPVVVRHCSKCNKKMSFYCSEKFRLNSNSQRVDIWLIYKCRKCDTTWKLTLMRGIRPHDLAPEMFDKMTNNNKELAWKYAFDRQLLKQNGCDIDYSGVEYSIEGLNICKSDNPLLIHVASQYFFDLKLSAFLAEVLGTSVSGVRKMVDKGLITTSLDCDIMKYRIRADFDLEIMNKIQRRRVMPILEEMSAFFNSRASTYDEVHVGHIDGGIEGKRIIASFLPEHTKSLIDFGIGTGLELEEIFTRFSDIEVTGVDIAGELLQLLLEKYPNRNITLHCESYLDYDFGHELYDVALSVMTLHHYTHEVKTALYRKIHDSIKPSGAYIECDYMLDEQEKEEHYFAEYERLKQEQGITDDREYHYDTPCTVTNQKKMLLDAGFSDVEEVWRVGNTVILVARK